MRRISAILALASLFVVCSPAQEDRATITGTVTDASNAPIAGASISIDSNATGFHSVVTTNDSGSYSSPGLLVGFYRLKIGKPGFQTEEVQTFQLVVGQVRTINARIQIATSTQEISVVDATPALEQSSATVGGVLSSSQVQSLPINGRAWTALMALVPGAIDSGGGTQKSIRFAGRGGDDNNFRFDGVDATGISNQAPNAGYRLQISSEAVNEFKVDTVLYGARTGGTSGGQVEVISKSGTNSFHGSAFEYLRNDAISARGPFDPHVLPPLRLNQYGASAGGSIVKNRTFFFAAYEGLRQRVGTTLIGNVPSEAFRATILAQSPALAPIVKAYPNGNRALNATTSQLVSTGSLTSNEDSGLIRIDHRLSDSTNFYARYNIDQVLITSPSGKLLDKSLSEAAPMNGTLNLSHVFSPTTFNVIQLGVNRVHRQGTTDSNFFRQTGLVNSIAVPGLEKLNQASGSVGSPTTYSLKDDYSWNRGVHSIRAGVEIKRILYNYSQPSENGIIYSSLAAFQANQVDQVNLIGGVPTHGLYKTVYFGYIEDAWKIQPELTLNLGMRYEFFNSFHEKYGRSLSFDVKSCGYKFCAPGGNFTNPDYSNLEPRVSFAWSPKMLGGKTVIRSGFGIYKGEGQLGDLNAPSDNYTLRYTITSSNFPTLSFPADRFYALASVQDVTPRALQRNRHDPTVQEWGLQIQTVLPMSFLLDTGYIGYHGYHQFYRSYQNLLDPVTRTRPIAGFGPIDSKDATGNNHFNGWQTSLVRQFHNGVSFQANYLWSHAINDGPNGGGEADYAENNACRSCEVASSNYDVRQVFSSNTVYELPFGKGRKFMTGGGIADRILGGWQFSGIGTFRTGNPVNVILARTAASLPDGNSVSNGASFQRPNYVGGVPVIPANQSIFNWIDKSAFQTPADGTFGNAGRNLVRGPNFWQADVSLTKNFLLTERFSLAFRAEGFNIFNRAQFGDPVGNFSSGSFGQITTTVNGSNATGSGTPREFQLALRLFF